MSIDVIPENQLATQSPHPEHPIPERDAALVSLQDSSPILRRRWVLLAIAAIAVVLTMVWLRRASPPETGPQLTHRITRGDLVVTVTEQGTLESSENTEIKCKVRGRNAVLWVVESGTHVKAGDELVRLDTLFIEEQINERSKYAHWSRSAAERSKADVAKAALAIGEYEEGRYVSELMRLQKNLAIAESNLSTAQNMLSHAKAMADSGYTSQLAVEEQEFAVSRAKLDVEVQKTQIDVLKRFTKHEQLQTLTGNLAADKARHEANVERAFADASRRDRAVEEFEHCVIRAERSGLVIHPSAARWENAPEIAEGVRVWKNQVLLLMPDLTKMQVKVGIHETIIERIEPGLTASVALPTRTLDGEVSSVASVTRPAGWWNGNEVKYDTTIALPSLPGLIPGMSAEVEIRLARYDDVLMIPVAALVEGEDGDSCWVKTPTGIERRSLVLGDSNHVFTAVESGLQEGDEVLLNSATLEQMEVGTPAEEEGSTEPDSSAGSQPQESSKPAKSPKKQAQTTQKLSS